MAWFAWADRIMTDAPATLTEATRPALWVDGRGHGWRIVVTTEGPELRPNLENPFLQISDLPIITAILVTPTALRVELTTRGGRRVATLPVGSVSLADIGCAMLAAMELPHDGIDRLDVREWRRARDRWAGTPPGRPRSRRSPPKRRTRQTVAAGSAGPR